MILGSRLLQEIVVLIDVEICMRLLFLHFSLAYHTNLFRVFTCMSGLGWACNSNRILKSLRRQVPASHCTSKPHGQFEGRFIDADAQSLIRCYGIMHLSIHSRLQIMPRKPLNFRRFPAAHQHRRYDLRHCSSRICTTCAYSSPSYPVR